MDCRFLKSLFVLLVCLMTAVPVAAKDPQILMWDEMVPENELASPPLIPDPEAGSPFAEEGDPLGGWTYGTEPVVALDGKYVKLPGFVVPLESDEGGLLDEFLLVPYFGACIHVPPPPPNQIVYVRLEEPYELTNIWDPYWIIGTIETKPYSGDIAQTVYQMTGERVEKYDY